MSHSIAYLEAKEVQEILDVSAVCLHKWRALPGTGPEWIKVERRFLYPSEPFQEYLEALTGGQPVPKGLRVQEKTALFRALHRTPSTTTLAKRLAIVERKLAALQDKQNPTERAQAALTRGGAELAARMASEKPRKVRRKAIKRRRDFPGLPV